MNICIKSSPNHKIFKELRNCGFKLITKESTHIHGGHIDQAWIKTQNEGGVEFDISMYSPVYNCTDHDAILICAKNPSADKFSGINHSIFFRISYFS